MEKGSEELRSGAIPPASANASPALPGVCPMAMWATGKNEGDVARLGCVLVGRSRRFIGQLRPSAELRPNRPPFLGHSQLRRQRPPCSERASPPGFTTEHLLAGVWREGAGDGPHTALAGPTASVPVSNAEGGRSPSPGHVRRRVSEGRASAECGDRAVAVPAPLRGESGGDGEGDAGRRGLSAPGVCSPTWIGMEPPCGMPGTSLGDGSGTDGTCSRHQPLRQN